MLNHLIIEVIKSIMRNLHIWTGFSMGMHVVVRSVASVRFMGYFSLQAFYMPRVDYGTANRGRRWEVSHFKASTNSLFGGKLWWRFLANQVVRCTSWCLVSSNQCGWAFLSQFLWQEVLVTWSYWDSEFIILQEQIGFFFGGYISICARFN